MMFFQVGPYGFSLLQKLIQIYLDQPHVCHNFFVVSFMSVSSLIILDRLESCLPCISSVMRIKSVLVRIGDEALV